MLLELLSDFQITIPELGQISATTMPIVVLTSNNSRELTEALKRRCLYLWLDYPELEREMEIVRLHAPDLPETLARRLVEVVRMVRGLDLKKPPSIAESIDWARTLLLMGAEDIDHETFEQSMSIIVKHRTDIDLVAERVGMKLRGADPGRVSPRPRPTGREPTPARRAWRRSCSASARSCAARGWRSGPRRSSTPSRRSSRCRGPRRTTSARRWRRRSPSRRRTGACSSCSSSAGSSAPPRPRRSSARSARASSATRARERLDIDELREQIREAILEGDDGEMRDLARLAIAAFGRQGEGSGVVGVDVQRIRRTLGLSAGPQPRRRGRRRRAAADRPRPAQPLRAPPPPRARTRPDRAHLDPSPLAPAGRARPGAADQPDPGPGGGPPRRLADEAATGDPRPRAARAAQGPHGRRAAHDALLAGDRRRAAAPPLPAEAAAPTGDLRPLRRLDLGHLGQRLLPLGPPRPARLVPQTAQLRLHRADLGGDRDLRARARLPRRRPADLERGRRRRRLRLHRLRPGLARVPRRDLRRARPALDRDRPRRCPHQRPRAPRRGLRPGRRAGRPAVLAQPRAEALLELRRLGDGRLRALLRRRLRVLDRPGTWRTSSTSSPAGRRRATSAACPGVAARPRAARRAPAFRRRRGRRG